MLEFLNGYSAHLIYALLFVLLLLCGLGFPMAEELVLLAGGFWWASGVLDPIIMLLVNVLGVVIGDVFLFGLGRGVSSRLGRSPRFTAWFTHKLERGSHSLHAMAPPRCFLPALSLACVPQPFSLPGRCRCRCGVSSSSTPWRASFLCQCLARWDISLRISLTPLPPGSGVWSELSVRSWGWRSWPGSSDATGGSVTTARQPPHPKCCACS